MKVRIGALCTALCLFGCMGGSGDEKATHELDSLIRRMEVDTSDVSSEVLEQIVKTVPSPLLMSAFLESSGAGFSQNLLHNHEQADDYASAFEMAVNLGIYGADLGYINVYKKNHIAVEYLNAIKRLADGLKVGQFFDFQTMKRMTANRDDLDSLIDISTKGFENMDAYLKEKNRGVMSALILYGGWTEALYLASQVVSGMDRPSEELMARIGEQKMVLENLEDMLSIYKSQPYFTVLLEELRKLREVYEPVEIIVAEAETEMEEVNGVLTVVDKSSSTVKIEPEQLKAITRAIAQVRTQMTKSAG